MPTSEMLRNIRVVLARPSHPGNIGAAARAMRTMGLTRLVLVAPERYPHAEATALAANAADVLDAAVCCATLDEALADTGLQVAFTARSRALSHAMLPVRAAVGEVVQAARAAPALQIALVFGNETYGLSNEEVLRCNRAACIPTDPESSSLNLAAAVQVAAYELWLATLDAAEPTRGEAGATGAAAAAQPVLAPHADVERFLEHLEQSLYRSGFLQPGNPRRLMDRMRRLYARAGLEPEEINVLRGMLSAWDGTGGRHGV
jgi:tRNA/rRNA methyltransferase